MNFVNPLFLLGALATAVPILLHLIKRESAQKIEFSTLMFLRKISRRTIRYQKLRHLLLLLLRLLMLLLLVAAFMRPFLDRPRAAGASGRLTAAHVILLDNSMSMGYGDRWDRARAEAAAIVRRAEPGDKVALLTFSDRTNLLSLPATDFAVVLDLINGAGLTDRATRYGQALKIGEKSALDAGADRRILYVISDFQKSGWATDENDFRLGSGIELRPIDVGSDRFSNLTLGDVQVLDAEEDKGVGLRIRFSAVNLGTEDRKAARVALTVDDRTAAERRADVARGAVEGMEFQLPALLPGMHNVALEVEDSGLARDNRFVLTMEARGKIPVLSVETAAAGRRPPSFFLATALNISAVSRYRLTAITPQEFASLPSIPGGLVIWNNTAGAGAGLQARLQQFAKGGGGLIVVLADGSLAADFGRSFASWLPVKVGDPGGNSGGRPGQRPGSDYALLTDLRMDHPIFRPFDAPNSGSFSGARIFRHARLQVSEGAQVLARFDNGDPALVSCEVDKGRVLVLATSADDAANDLPVKAVYAPLWHQMLRFLENFRQERQWYDVGDTISPRRLLVEAAVRKGKSNLNLNQAMVVMDPSRRRVTLAPGSDAVELDAAGFYDVRTEELAAGVAVNPAARESDLTHGNAEEMAAGWMSTEAKAAPVISSDELPTPEEQDRRTRWWRYLLAGMLAALVLEGLLANRFILKPE